MNVPITDVTYPELRFALLAADIFLGQDQTHAAFRAALTKPEGELRR